ncbi:epoxide hydrolase family protein [Streptomyces sp. SID13031]|uniref:alpha/beta fold hydrolase n=1 Tax=Streptomyces sp. SID13031 TaxID=2706046 RepID=UPI0013CC0CD1|nr:epoxide hydrolase [Streptomyces sp. SID13031]
MPSTQVTPFQIQVPDSVLDDLRARLQAARPATPAILDGGETPELIERIEGLLAYWRDGYDWRAEERRLNKFPQFRATVDGVGLHFLHVRGSGPDPLPLLLTNGWPSSFVEYLAVLEPLTEAGFSVVVPALPGLGFSDRCLDLPLSRSGLADLFNQLMVDVLGYRHYVAHGDDIGGRVVSRLGIHHSADVRAIQTANWFTLPTPDEVLDDAALAYDAAGTQWDQTHGAYAHVQETRPQTLTYALNDSPTGLAAWILEKFLTWSDPATRTGLSDDDLLTTVMIYWCTQTIGSSMRLYALQDQPRDEFGPVLVPASVLVPNEPDLPAPPESALRRAYPQLFRHRELTRGGHFLALESPETFVDEVTAAFADYLPRR